MANTPTIPDKAEIVFNFRHAELVSASMACAFDKHSASGEIMPWPLERSDSAIKQVQGDVMFGNEKTNG